MTGTGQADPTIGPYIGMILDRFLSPTAPWFAGQPTFSDYIFKGLTTPEQFCPIVCQPLPIPFLNFGQSLAEGVNLLEAAIRPQLEAGDNVAVFGFSQSATIATLAMNALLDNPPGGLYDPANVSFVLIGAPNNPIGGILARLLFGADDNPSAQHLPFINVPLGIGASPTTPFATDVYTAEYDGWANFPQNPANLLALINALIGIQTVHSSYPVADNLGDTINLGAIGDNNFYMIPEQLPILWPLYQVPYVLPVLGEFLAPMLKLSIDWAYGNPGDPDAGIAVNGVDPIGAAGPWAVTATGQLADTSAAPGFLARMDPLQMLAGLQYAGVQTVVGPINEILREIGQQPLPDTVTNALLTGYHLTNDLDQLLLTGWHELATDLNLADLLGPAAVFNGAPLISAQPLVDLVGLGFSVFNVFGA